MGFITMLTLRVPVIQHHLVILMGLLLMILMGLLLMIPMRHLLVIPMRLLQSLQMMDMGVLLALIMRMMYYPSITMVFITMVGQVIRLLLQIPMELLEKYPPRATLHQQLGTLCLFLAATRIPRLTSCQSISSLRSPLV